MSPIAALRSTVVLSHQSQQQETTATFLSEVNASPLTTATFLSEVDTSPLTTATFLSDMSMAVARASVSTAAAPASIGTPLSAPTALGAETRAEPLIADVAALSVATPAPFTLLQQWEGVVAEPPTADDFVATLRDLTAPSRAEERATLPLEQVPSADRRLVIAGAVFYWSIGYEDLSTGTRRTVSELRFRRLPAWSKNDMRRVKQGVERLKDILRDFE